MTVVIRKSGQLPEERLVHQQGDQTYSTYLYGVLDLGVKMVNLVNRCFQNRQLAKEVGIPDGDFLWCIHVLQ